MSVSMFRGRCDCAPASQFGDVEWSLVINDVVKHI